MFASQALKSANRNTPLRYVTGARPSVDHTPNSEGEKAWFGDRAQTG